MPKTLKILTAILAWFGIWFISGSLVNTGLADSLLAWLDQYGPTVKFAVLTSWMLFVVAIISWWWFTRIKDASFLVIHDKRWLLVYLVPLSFAAYTIITGQPTFNVNRWVYLIGILLTTFFGQDMATFGFLQTYMEKLLRPWHAALLVTAVFFIGHLYIQLSALAAIYLLGFLLFALLRYKFKNIYVLNALHLSFLLLPF